MHPIEWRILWQNGGQHPCCFVHNHLCSKDSLYEPLKIFHVTRGGQLPKEGQDPRDEDLLMFEGSKIELQIKHKIFVSQESCGKTMSTTRFDLLRPLCYGGVSWAMNHYRKETRDKISQGSCGKPMSTTRLDLLRPLCHGGVIRAQESLPEGNTS